MSSSATSTVSNGTPSSTPTSTEEHECYILLGFEDNIGCPQEDWAIATPQLSGKLPFQVKAPCNVLPISLHHDYESYSTDWTGQVESILASPGENPELHKIPEFTGRAVEAFQSSEVEFEKPRPASHEDSVLESSLDIKSSILTDSSNMFLAHACRRAGSVSVEKCWSNWRIHLQCLAVICQSWSS